MSTSPIYAAAVLSAETELSVNLPDLLRGGKQRAKLAGKPVEKAALVLTQQANLLAIQTNPEASPDKDKADTRSLQRLARAIIPCLEFLEILADHSDDKLRLLSASPPHLACAAGASASAISAFARLGSQAFDNRIATALIRFVQMGVNDPLPGWRNVVLEQSPYVVPALSQLVEDGDFSLRRAVSKHVYALLLLVESYLLIPAQGTGDVAEGASALLLLAVSTVSLVLEAEIDIDVALKSIIPALLEKATTCRAGPQLLDELKRLKLLVDT